jgi:hypothetical protein
MFRDRPQIGIGHIRWFHFDGGTNRPSFSPMRSLNKAGAFLAGHRCLGSNAQWRLKNCTARSCFSAAARVLKVPRLRRRPVFGLILRE